MTLYGQRQARRSLLNTLGFRAASQAVTLASFIVLARALSEQDFGVFNLLYALIPVLNSLASLGLEQTLKRFLPEYLQRDNAGAGSWLVHVVAIIRIASNTALLVLLLAFWNLLAPIFHLQDYRIDFIWFGVLLLLYFQGRILESALASHMLHRWGVGSTLLIASLKLLSYGALAFAHVLHLRSALIADALAYGAAYLFMRIAYVRHALSGRAMAVRPARTERLRIRRYALYNNFNDAGAILLHVQTDNFFIAALLDTAAVGAYSFYTRINAMVSNVVPVRLFENVALPMLFATKPGDAPCQMPRYFTFLVNCSLVVQLPLIAYTMVYHHEVVTLLLGGKYASLSWLLPVVIAFGATSNVLAIPITSVAQYEERASLILSSQLFGIYQIICMLLLVPRAGLLGAAVATGTLHLFRNLFVWWRVRRLARWINFRAALVWTLGIWTPATLLCVALRNLPGPPYAALSCGLLVCAVATLAFACSPALCASDRDLLGKLFHGREAKLLRALRILERPQRPASSPASPTERR
jgi:O-antigen/teichoic acid export membrane protein